MADSIDLVDLRLIRYLQDHPRASYSQVARETGVSETTARRRIEQLTESRVITTAVIPNIYRLGYRTRATIALKIDLAHMMEIAETIRAMPEVAFVSLTTGRWDLTFFVMLPSLGALTEFMIERIAPIPGIRESETLVTPRVLKVFADWRVPVDALLDQHNPGAEDGSMGPVKILLPHDDE